jgi:hypothetical protein
VTVTIPSYRYGRFLRRSVGSALDQAGVEVEVIIIDNASPDDTAKIAHEIASEDERVRVIARDVDLGYISAFNEGIELATGDYTVMLPADDILTPGSLARSAAVFEARPDVGLVYGFSPYFADRPPNPRTRARSWRVWSGTDWLEIVCQRARDYVFTAGAAMRTSLMRSVGGFEPRLPHTCDFHMWMCAAVSSSVAYVSGPDQAFCHLHGDNMSIVEFGGFISDISERHRAFELFFDRFGPNLPEAERLRHRAVTALSREALLRASQAFDRGATGRVDAATLAGMAASYWPQVRDTRLWAAYEWHGKRQRPDEVPARTPRHVAARVIEESRRQLGLLRWRHFGA